MSARRSDFERKARPASGGEHRHSAIRSGGLRNIRPSGNTREACSLCSRRSTVPTGGMERQRRGSPMRRLNLAVGVLCAIALMSAAAAERKLPPKPPMPTGYNNPGPPPANALPKIIDRLRTELKDPYSIRDFKACAPSASEAYYSYGRSAWRPATWSSIIALNSKNSYGAYTGVKVFSVQFEHGEAVSINEMSGLGGLIGPTQNAELMTRTHAIAQACPRIPDAEIQRLLQVGGAAIGAPTGTHK